jgi:TM2 domain-containing membrane protein YozV
MDLYFLCSILAIDIFIILFALFSWITKGIHRLHNRANILGMLLIMLLSHVEIHISHL